MILLFYNLCNCVIENILKNHIFYIIKWERDTSNCDKRFNLITPFFLKVHLCVWQNIVCVLQPCHCHYQSQPLHLYTGSATTWKHFFWLYLITWTITYTVLVNQLDLLQWVWKWLKWKQASCTLTQFSHILLTEKKRLLDERHPNYSFLYLLIYAVSKRLNQCCYITAVLPSHASPLFINMTYPKCKMQRFKKIKIKNTRELYGDGNHWRY